MLNQFFLSNQNLVVNNGESDHAKTVGKIPSKNELMVTITVDQVSSTTGFNKDLLTPDKSNIPIVLGELGVFSSNNTKE